MTGASLMTRVVSCNWSVRGGWRMCPPGVPGVGGWD